MQVPQLHSEKERKYRENPNSYEIEINGFINKEYCHEVKEFTFENITGYFMAYAIMLVANQPVISLSKKISVYYYYNDYRPLLSFIQKSEFHGSDEKYIWTCLMILGLILPEKQFGMDAIGSFNHSESFVSETGYFSRFGSYSLYEKIFKKYLTKSKVEFYLNSFSIENVQKCLLKKKCASYHQSVLNLKDTTADIEKIKNILDESFDINHQDDDNLCTALIVSIINKNYKLAEYLLTRGADPFLRNKNGEKASDLADVSLPIYFTLKGYELLYATYNGDLTTMRLALNEGADIDFKALGGYTPLLISVEQSFIQLTEFLLMEGADLTANRNDGQGVFELATDMKIFEVLNKYNEIDIPVLEDFSENIESNPSSISGFFTNTVNFLTWRGDSSQNKHFGK